MRPRVLTCLAFVLVACSSTHSNSGGSATPPAATFPGLPAGPIGTTGASRLLTQGTFGPTLDTIQSTSTQTYAQWFAAQYEATPSLLLPQISATTTERLIPWWTIAVNGPDQLRQRASFALSELLVVSSSAAVLVDATQAIAAYNDLLVQNCLGNFRDLLNVITLSPAMGQYLTYFKSDKPNPATGSHADENYAREVMQLFTIGLVTLNPDGSQQTDSSGAPIPTYGLPEIENLARVFTGWASAPIPPHQLGDEQAWMYDLDYLHPMACYPAHHDTGAKTIIGGVNIPAGGTCESDLKIALDTLFNHPNMGPFVGRQLIERLVTSNPSPAYIGRVAAAFNNDGKGVRGDMLVVLEAVLSDPEARTAGTASKLREPILRFTELYRALAGADLGGDGLISEQQVAQVQALLNLYEEPFWSPTVFNFFTPSYERPGALLNAGLVAPEFEITNENSIVLLTNQIETSSYQYVDSSGTQHAGSDGYSTLQYTSSTNVMLHTAEWEPFASDPSMLLDQLNLVFMAGQMPSAMKQTILPYVTNIPASSPGQRVAEATFLVVGSPQFAVQR